MASSELLKQIQAGKKLKKAETNDRSAPAIDPKPSGSTAGAGPRGPTPAPAIPSGSGPPQLGGLFAGGMPKLKPAGQGNLAKPPTLGKPPVAPGRAAPSPAPSALLPPLRMTPPKPSTPPPPPPPATAPALPSRAAPALPSRAPAIPARAPPLPTRVPTPPTAVPVPPRRPPPPPRTASPPAPLSSHPMPPARPPPVTVRSASPVGTLSTTSRIAPLPPTRSGNPTLPARKAPPPPPARPSSIAGSMPARAVPPPPVRKTPVVDGVPALLPHVRALSEVQSSAGLLPRGPPPPRTNLLQPVVPLSRPRVVSRPQSETPIRPSTAPPNRQVNGTRPSVPTRKIPSPPPDAGSHRFPTSSDFPPPRKFVPGVKLYGGGRQRGSDFDISNI